MNQFERNIVNFNIVSNKLVINFKVVLFISFTKQWMKLNTTN